MFPSLRQTTNLQRCSEWLLSLLLYCCWPQTKLQLVNLCALEMEPFPRIAWMQSITTLMWCKKFMTTVAPTPTCYLIRQQIFARHGSMSSVVASVWIQSWSAYPTAHITASLMGIVLNLKMENSVEWRNCVSKQGSGISTYSQTVFLIRHAVHFATSCCVTWETG